MTRLGAWLRERQAHRTQFAAAVGYREAERAPAVGLIREHKLVYRRAEQAVNTIENSREDASAMAFEQITTELSERVLTVTLNRPERLNAWTATMAEELIDAFDRADADDEVRVIIVTGAGRGFCAGADLAAGPRPSTTGHAGAPPTRCRVTTAAGSFCACSTPPSP